jgi:hypothetical protein
MPASIQKKEGCEIPHLGDQVLFFTPYPDPFSWKEAGFSSVGIGIGIGP